MPVVRASNRTGIPGTKAGEASLRGPPRTMDSSCDQEVGLGFGKVPALDPGPAGYSGGSTAGKLRAAAISGGPGGTQSTPGGEEQQCEEWNP